MQRTSYERGFTISNSDSKCLVENWVEERRSKVYDDGKSDAELSKYGHQHLLSIRDDPCPPTTYRDDYVPKDKNLAHRKYVGSNCRKDFLNQMFTQRAIEQLQREEEEEARRQIEEKLQSETAHAYWKEQQLMQQMNVQDHDLVKEQPITFWTEHHKHITGNTRIPNGMIDSPFRKNSQFSKPISERYDDWACDDTSPSIGSTKFSHYKK